MNISLTKEQEELLKQYAANLGFEFAGEALVQAAMVHIKAWLAPSGVTIEFDDGEMKMIRAYAAEHGITVEEAIKTLSLRALRG